MRYIAQKVPAFRVSHEILPYSKQTIEIKNKNKITGYNDLEIHTIISKINVKVFSVTTGSTRWAMADDAYKRLND